MSVDPARWQVLSPYLDEALDLSPEARRGWLEGLRGKDPALAADLQALLDEGAALSREGFLAGTLAPVPEASLEGSQVGANTLISALGRGGMGTVWLAERSDGRFTTAAAVRCRAWRPRLPRRPRHHRRQGAQEAASRAVSFRHRVRRGSQAAPA